MSEVFPTPDHNHERCAADVIAHGHGLRRPFAAADPDAAQGPGGVGREFACHWGLMKSSTRLLPSGPRPAPITIYRALDFLMDNGLVHRIESRNAFLACALQPRQWCCGGISDLAKFAAMSARRRATISARSFPQPPAAQASNQKCRLSRLPAPAPIAASSARADLIAADIPMTAAPTTAYQARSLDIGPVMLIVLMCMCWGLNQVAVKFSLLDIPVIMRGGNPLGWRIADRAVLGVVAADQPVRTRWNARARYRYGPAIRTRVRADV